MLLTSTLAISCKLRNFLNKAFGIINSAKPFLNLIDDTGSGLVVECLTRDRGAAGSSLTGITALWSLSKAHLS